MFDQITEVTIEEYDIEAVQITIDVHVTEMETDVKLTWIIEHTTVEDVMRMEFGEVFYRSNTPCKFKSHWHPKNKSGSGLKQSRIKAPK